MLDFTTLNVDGVYRSWSFEDVEELRRAYHSDEADVPMLDDPVADMEFHGIPMYVDNFGDIVRLFGIEEE